MIGREKNKYMTKLEVSDAVNHIEDYWSTLYRKKTDKASSTIIPLPNPYIVPSPGNGNFSFNEQYYWDSYFTILGLKDKKLAVGMLDNLVHLYEEFGMIPNANRYYFTSRSQPPILTTYIFHIYDTYGMSKSWLKKYISVAKKEYHSVWMSEDHPHERKVHFGLSRYYDINYLHDLAEAESGWDMTPRFKRQCLDYLPVDLNCLLYKYEADFARAANIQGDEAEERVWHYAAEERQRTVNKLMWNERKGFFFDFNYHEKKQGSVWSLAAYYAAWSGLASPHQVKKLVKNLEKFEKDGGLTTTLSTFMYTKLFGSTKTQWAYPNGWAPLHYIACEGIESYGFHKDAKRIAHKWMNTCNSWFLYNGYFQEKYNVVNTRLKPVEGVYPTQIGFGWTNGIFIYFAEKYIEK